MSDYIKREDAECVIGRFIGYLDDDMIQRQKIAIRKIPAADVRENVRGEWIIHHEQKNVYGGVTVECSMCHTKYVVMRVADENFCRNCGARMRGNDDG